MKIFYDLYNEELLTEEEAKEKIEDKLIIQDFIVELQNYDFNAIWDMLTIEAQNEIINACREHMMEENFIVRDFK